MYIQRIEEIDGLVKSLLDERVQLETQQKEFECVAALNITSYLTDNFAKVCDICNKESTEKKWKYINIVEDIMFADHKSWLYMLTVDDIIFKVGETGNLLGYRTSEDQKHPTSSTKGRLGRYIQGSDTDQNIRTALQSYLDNGSTISFWVKKCEVLGGVVSIFGGKQQEIIYQSYHKDLEVIYLDFIKEKTGSYPALNKGRK